MRKLLFLLLNLVLAFCNSSNFLPSPQIIVCLEVFSGTDNPCILLKTKHLIKLEKILDNNNFKEKKTKRIMGYQGFFLRDERYDDILSQNPRTKIKGNPTAEMFLLGFFQDSLNAEVLNHILEKIATEYLPKDFIEVTDSTDESTDMKVSFNEDCNNTPIKGPDNITVYNPDTDDFGCFETMQYNNNCYNYSTDIVTNTFAQPGRGTSHKWKANTCEDVKVAAISDGLSFIGSILPEKQPDKGHYVGMLIWPNTNFHWVRMDANGYWSHKPGGTEIRNTDNEGNQITDPSTQDFSPWSQFCGYFLVIPSDLTIN